MDELWALTEQLSSYIPSSAAPSIASQLIDLNVQLTVAKPRVSKLGDFRPPGKVPYAKISVNGDLNPELFLAVLLHELAHLNVYNRYRNSVKAHGKEWRKAHFDILYTYQYAFSTEVFELLIKHAQRNKSATLHHPDILYSKLFKDHNEGGVLLRDLKENEAFSLRMKTYRILQKKRTRFLCIQLKTGKKYLISGAAIVQPISD